ncbi:MAG: helix-hairpin-helix domain-containing protein [Hespellia sp.]|nr:helix-hairpin-helix domain-containing protein [Hespellia sp.]
MRERTLRYMLGWIAILSVIVICGGCREQEKSELERVTIEDTKENGSVTEEESENLTVENQKEEKVWVYICGAVNQPGVYTFDSEVRIFEVIAQAGGMTEAASATFLNQAQLVLDGEQIYVPTQEEVDAGNVGTDASEGTSDGNQSAGTQTAAKDGRVNINTASKEELMTLTGIGEAKADSIIAYRETQGGFQSIEDIMQIEGIKEGVFRKIEDQITV